MFKMNSKELLKQFEEYVVDICEVTHGLTEENIKGGGEDHRSKGLIDLYLLKNKEHYWTLFSMRVELGLVDNFERVKRILFDRDMQSDKLRQLTVAITDEYGLVRENHRRVREVVAILKHLQTFVARMQRKEGPII